jgi:hypothetical protein
MFQKQAILKSSFMARNVYSLAESIRSAAQAQAPAAMRCEDPSRQDMHESRTTKCWSDSWGKRRSFARDPVVGVRNVDGRRHIDGSFAKFTAICRDSSCLYEEPPGSGVLVRAGCAMAISAGAKATRTIIFVISLLRRLASGAGASRQ